MENKIYFDGFDSAASVFREFNVPEEDQVGVEILFAEYDLSEEYSGSAFVVFREDGDLYEVHGSHCSCHGLEDLWEPEKTSVEALQVGNYAYDKEGWGAVLQSIVTGELGGSKT